MIFRINALLLFFQLLILPIYAESFHLNQEIFNKIISLKDRTPLFIELWDPHCHNCKAFKGDWEKLTSHEFFQKKIIFADINCISENNLCQKISPGKEYPRFVWFDANETIPRTYTGSYSLSDLALWLKSQFQSPLNVINDAIQFEKIKQIALKIPLFRFTINESDKQSIQILKEAVNSVKHLRIKMILTYSNQQASPILEHFTSDYRTIEMTSSFTYNSIINFIKVHSIRFFIPYNDLIGQFSSAEKVPIMIFVFSHNNSQLRKEAINAAREIEELSIILTSQVCCEYNSHFCGYYGIKNDNKNITVVIIDKFRSLFWSLNYNYDVNYLKKWTVAVLNNKIKPYGPGSTKKFLKPSLELFYELRGHGGWRYYFFFAPFVAMFLFVIILAFYFAIPNLDQIPNDSQNNSKEKNE